jgi:hypothetical protein
MSRTDIISAAGVTAAGSFVFLIMRLSLFAQPDSNGNATGTHEGTDEAGNTASWETRELPNMHFRFKLPPDYKRKQWAVVVGTPAPSATFQLGHENHIDFTIENVEDANPENAKVGLQKDYVDYKEWSQVIGGQKKESACRTVLRRYAQSTRNMYCGLVPC